MNHRAKVLEVDGKLYTRWAAFNWWRHYLVFFMFKVSNKECDRLEYQYKEFGEGKE